MVSKKRVKSDKKVVVLLDTHAILHRAYHALPDFSTKRGEPTGALYGVVTMLTRIIEEFHPDHIIACYDRAEPTFRHDEYAGYKDGRAKTDDALIDQIERSHELLEKFGIPIYDAVGFEADDILGTFVEGLKARDDLEIIIASGDMDTLQLIKGDKVRVFTLKKGIKDTILYGEEEVKKRFGFGPQYMIDYKGLRGDPSDNIPGVAGIGEKTATELITQFGSVEDIYSALESGNDKIFEKAGIKPRVIKLLTEGKDEALFSKSLATIRRDAPITVAIPKKKWFERIDVDDLTSYLDNLEFRSLKPRIAHLLESRGVDEAKTLIDIEVPAPKDDPELFRKAQIAYWLLDSDESTPSREDITDRGRSENLEEALANMEVEIEDAGIGRVYREMELPLIEIIRGMEETGILLDTTVLGKLSKTLHTEIEVLEKAIYRAAGEEFNINSPKQLAHILFETLGVSRKGIKKTAGGAVSTRESELQKLATEHDIVGHILNYRELQKLVSTYVDTLPKLVAKDGRVHSQLHQTGTATGRMSSTDPNMQNLPAGSGWGSAIRAAFITPPNATFLAFDYSQIEMRVLAELSGDKKLIKIFSSGQDVHSQVAAFVYGVPESDVTKDMRRRAKVVNFGIIYGMGVNALKDNLGTTRKEAEEFYASYFDAFPTIRAYFDTVVAEAHRLGYTTTLFGRRRYLPGLRSHIPYIRAAQERMALNAPIQGTAADLIKLAMVRVHEALVAQGLEDGVRMILQIHDELVFEAKDELLEETLPHIRDAMESVGDMKVPLVVNASKGPNLGELKDIT